MSEECCCIYVDDGDYPSFANATLRRAAKPHRCGECGETIRPGEEYEDARQLEEGRWYRYKTCSFCLKIRRDFFPCGWYYEGLVESFQDCMGWDYRDDPADWDDEDDD